MRGLHLAGRYERGRKKVLPRLAVQARSSAVFQRRVGSQEGAGRLRSTSIVIYVALLQRPARLFDPLPPALHLPGHQRCPDRLKADNEPQTGLSAGRAECRDRPSRAGSESQPAADRPPFPCQLR